MTNTYNGSSGEVAVFVNPHQWHISGRLAAALPSSELALSSSTDITASLKEEARQCGELLADLFVVVVALPATRVSEQTQALNAWSLPLRRGRWLSVWPPMIALMSMLSWSGGRTTGRCCWAASCSARAGCW